jgi:hypothetical protein
MRCRGICRGAFTKMRLKCFLVSTLIQAFLIASCRQVQADVPGFAIHLYRTGEHLSAVLELERFIYHHPEDPFVPYARYLQALAHARADQSGPSEARLRELLVSLEQAERADIDGGLYCECNVQLLNLLYRENRFADFELELDRFHGFCSDADPELDAWVWNLDLAAQLHQRNWEGALELVRRSPPLEENRRDFLERRIDGLRKERMRLPVLGGLFSVVPGLGYVYAGRPLDGLRSFFINSAGIGLSVFCFVMGLPVLGTVFVMVEAALFTANVYGGINAVMQRNARVVIEGRDELLKTIPLPPLDVLTLRDRFEVP